MKKKWNFYFRKNQSNCVTDSAANCQTYFSTATTFATTTHKTKTKSRVYEDGCWYWKEVPERRHWLAVHYFASLPQNTDNKTVHSLILINIRCYGMLDLKSVRSEHAIVRSIELSDVEATPRRPCLLKINKTQNWIDLNRRQKNETKLPLRDLAKVQLHLHTTDWLKNTFCCESYNNMFVKNELF